MDTTMVEDTSYMFVTGPNVVKTVTNETVTGGIGGASTISTKSGVSTYYSANDVECLEDLKKTVSYLPQSIKRRLQSCLMN
jgi:propionyl-CoA carboxylase beta chain